jgi:hypothetical protein
MAGLLSKAAVGRMGGVRPPLDLPSGLPHVAPDAELHEVGRRWRRGRRPGRRAVGRCQVEGMPHSSRCGGGLDRAAGVVDQPGAGDRVSPRPTGVLIIAAG